MKKYLIWGISIVAFMVVVLLAAGFYFYDVAIDRSDEPLALHGGKDESIEVFMSEEQSIAEEVIKLWDEANSGKVVEMASDDGLLLKADLVSQPIQSKKAAILVHGYKGNRTQMPGISKYYHDCGYNVLRPDLRGHGESEGDYIGYGWHERLDLVQWIEFLKEETGAEEIVLHGFSMGAATVLMTSGEDLPQEVKAVVADSGYTSVMDELSHQLKYLYNLPSFPIMQVTSLITDARVGYNFTEASALEQVKKNKVPLFIIHGADDELVPTRMAEALYEAANVEKYIWIAQGAQHTEAFTVNQVEYEQRLTEFLDKLN
ncbi:alpha/beta hydrolase [Mangrovibacillus cuniculi]|uniref:Alpha/beta hydrolase n=1 Tax=Mangrovibacillus cuniculi TaxID=2593652 RepID=A0A7S8C944_9BACI|nr:alpha/beta hydrolase [Mangrovibacillus cuniculi]QPC45700.1 alpha/beta hydrolase [Mangrovibacillus cuniculi]